jgi:light-regulated signal transduction histidine kinase (bacteriophytochrome)
VYVILDTTELVADFGLESVTLRTLLDNRERLAMVVHVPELVILETVGNYRARVRKAGDDARKGLKDQLSVTDHGIGIEPERLGTIFDRFVRGVDTTHYGGLGLGLYISRQIVELHGGTISVRSQPGAGATFSVELPTRLQEPR